MAMLQFSATVALQFLATIALQFSATIALPFLATIPIKKYIKKILKKGKERKNTL